MTINEKVIQVQKECAEKDIWYLESTLTFPKESIDEVHQVHEEGFFVPHRGGDSQGWHSCALHGWGIGDRAEYYRTMNPSGYGFTEEESTYGWTELEEIAPRTKEFLMDNFDCSVMRRSRFMLLEPGGFITSHSDGEGRNIRSAMNVCLTQPKDCYLRRSDTKEEVPFEPTKMFYYDNRIMHEAANNSKENRFHFIIHGYASDITKQNIIESYERDHGKVEL